ncbi:MAG: polymerase sigma-70 factor, subfamily [Candidatus Binatota bacterium]|jgi:RNA polymerase sigma-70 factor (ECF subfamily)|nr:polymerase sigma-70 factor, subfamily [Candidatus Binatota bacterium]
MASCVILGWTFAGEVEPVFARSTAGWEDPRKDAPRVDLSDEALCELVASKDDDAFAVLVERYRERSYRLAWSMLGDAEAARDVSQEAFLRLFEVAGRFDGRSRFSTWFHRIVVNLSIDHRRRERWWWKLSRRRPPEDPGDETELERQISDSAGPEERAASREVLLRVREVIDRLPPQQRAALVLQLEEDLPTREIAAALGCTESTARVHLHRALTTLKRAFRGA